MATESILISSSSSVADDLIVEEILIRIPDPRTAFRCKLVCKSWNSLISAPCFSRRFVSHHQTMSAAGEPKPPVLIPSKTRQLIWSFLPFPNEAQSKFSVLDRMNDLLLLGFAGRGNHDDDELGRTYLVCNPFTKQWVALPLAPEKTSTTTRRDCYPSLVCEAYNSPGLDLGDGQVFTCNLGYRRFRVVRLSDLASGLMQLEMFCSEVGEWTKLYLHLDGRLRCRFGDDQCAMAVNGEYLYWLNERHQIVKSNPFCLDYHNPPTLMDGSKLHYSCTFWTVSEGALHMICEEELGVGLSLWRLDEENRGGEKGWTRQYEVMRFEDLRCGDMIGEGCEIERLEWKFENEIALQRDRSEIIFLECSHPYSNRKAILTWDFKKKEAGFHTYLDDDFIDQGVEVFGSKFIFWPSPIPSYEKLRNTYNGSYECWLPPSVDQ